MKKQFNASSALSGFAIGAVITMLATVAVTNTGGGGGGSSPLILGTGAGVEDLGIDPDDVELAEGEQLAIDESGNAVVVDSGGNVVRKVSSSAGGSGGTEQASGSTAGRKAGSSGSGAAIGGGSSGGSTGSGGKNADGSDATCAAGKNGGATDVGVTGTEIKLGATVAENGIAKSFLGEVRQGMEAVKNKVNRAGGICGRQLKIVYKDDAWSAETGARYLQNLVEDEKVFALAVSPSSEGLNAASAQGYFKTQGVPVVGADGLNRTQFKDPMIWPVAAATTTTINIMMKNAYDRAKAAGKEFHPAIVFGNTYKFGVEGAYAANEAYKKVSGGKSIPGYDGDPTKQGATCKERFCGVASGQPSYSNQVSTINSACEPGTAPRCNYMILLLEPKTAQDWMATAGVKTAAALLQDGVGMGGPQPLFTYDFGRNCGDKCNGMWVWTGYNPPIEQLANSPAVSGFVTDLKSQSQSADEFNQFTMGGYVGMKLLVAALEQTGPNLTRAALINTLNTMGPLNTGLSVPLQWRGTARYANHSAQGFEIQSKNGFTGWKHVQTPIRDQWLGQHTG